MTVPGHGSSGKAVGDGTGDGVGDRVGDDLGAPAVAADGGVGAAAGLGLGSFTASQWGPVVPVPVQSQTGPTLLTVHTPGPHTSEEHAVTCTAHNTVSTQSTVSTVSIQHHMVPTPSVLAALSHLESHHRQRHGVQQGRRVICRDWDSHLGIQRRRGAGENGASGGTCIGTCTKQPMNASTTPYNNKAAISPP